MLFSGIPTIDTRNEQVDFSLPISVPWGTTVCAAGTDGLPFDLTGSTIEAGLLDTVGAEILSFSMAVDMTTSCISLSLTGTEIEALGLGWYYWYLRVELSGETEYTYWVGGRWNVHRVYTYGPRRDLPNPDVVDVVVGSEIIASVNVCAVSGAGGGGSGDLLAANNLSDVDNAAASLANIGGATAAQGALADTALQTVDVPTDINSTGGTPSAATFLRGDGVWAAAGGGGDLLAANNLSDVDNAATSLTNLGGATAAQGALADTATQPGDLGTLAAKDSIAVPGDVTATGAPSGTTFLRGDGVWASPGGGGGGDLLAANNLSDVDDAATSRINLGLGTAATTSSADYATAAQGALADTALQDASAFATAAQGALADTSLQDASAFATAAQGVTADSALQIVAVPSDITATGTPDSTTFLRGDGVWATTGSGNGDLLAANNLSDVDDVATSRTNLGLGTAATTSASDYATAAQGALADTALQDAAAFATAAQGALADTALQDASAFATAAQGTLADTALQDAAAFATAAQGVTADSALQTVDVPIDITATGTPGTTTFLRGDGVWAEPTGTSGDLLAVNNLSDVDNAATSLANLGGATAAQGALADTALQNAAAFATAAQGVTADSALQIVDVPIDINATGTPDSTTFLRGDGVWAEPTGTSGDLLAANNLSDVADAPTSLANLGGATAAQGALADSALQDAAAFATAAQGLTADSALQVVAVPSDITATGTPSTTTFLRGDGVWAEPSGTAGDLLAANNLSDVADAPTSLANLGGATAAQGALADTALQDAAAFATAAQGSTADSALQVVAVPSDITATGTPGTTTFLRGDGVWAEPAGTSGDLLAANNLSDVADAATSLANLGGATAAQGALADTALQNAAAFATAAQGALADTATQPGDLGTLAVKDAIDVPADVSATGTASSTTFLRGDGAWAVPAGAPGDLLAANNLSDVADAATSLSNLGGATAAQGALADTALQDASAFATAAQGVLADDAAPLLAATATRFRGYGATEPSTDLQVGDVFFKEA